VALQDHSAPGTSAAFDFQFERALSWLARSPSGSMIGIETDDDVVVRSASGENVFEQDKHSILAGAKPFGDRSKDLWNTLATWVNAVQTGEIQVKSSRFFMVTNKILSECIATKIGLAKSERDVEDCVAALIVAATAAPQGILKYVDTVLAPEARASLRGVIAACDFADGSTPVFGATLRAQILDHLQLPAWCSGQKDSIADELLGWMHTTALSTWQKNLPVWFARDHFVNHLHAIIDNRRRRMVRERAQHLIPIDDSVLGKERGRPFVKQLHLITDDSPVVDIAIREFLRCNIEKTRLSGEGNITDNDWIDFEQALLSRWEKISTRVVRMSRGQDERDVGYQVFTDTTEAHCERLAGSDTEQVYLTSGSYHRLADSSKVGWHPRFRELLKGEVQ
jgi:hypothetical protein